MDHLKDHHEFSIDNLAWAIQSKLNPKTVGSYLHKYEASLVRSRLQCKVFIAPGGPSFPILYFAAERNSPEICRILCKAGAEPGLRMKPLALGPVLPLLPYAVLSAEYCLSDTTDTVVTLLAMGASPSDIPRDMWQEPLDAPKKDKPWQSGRDGIDVHDAWCKPEFRGALARTLNLMQRYALWKADNMERPRERMSQLGETHDVLPLLEVPYHIIGQQFATQQVLDCISTQFLFKRSKPIVLLFTGPSGHGKTELASRMGDLLSLDMLKIDCTEMQHQTDMFGPKAPYFGYQDGSPLNNYLEKNAGQRAIIFVDEFDKTTDEVRNSMLLPLESGFYKDRRNNKQLDCSNMIWILAANIAVETIQKFWFKHLKDRNDEEQKKAPFAEVQKGVRQDVKAALGTPLTGRLLEVILFFPFAIAEQAVVAYKFMRERWTTARQPINTDAKVLAGHLFLDFVDDGGIARQLAQQDYDPELGARSLQDAEEREIGTKLTHQWSRQEGGVKDEMNEGVLEKYEVRVTTRDGVDEIEVKRVGFKDFLYRPNV